MPDDFAEIVKQSVKMNLSVARSTLTVLVGFLLGFFCNTFVYVLPKYMVRKQPSFRVNAIIVLGYQLLEDVIIPELSI